MLFEKKPKTISEQIQLLEGRGMTFKDKAKAESYFSNISYYRISAYWFTFLEDDEEDHKFKPGTDFQQIIDTYVFDRKLRVLIFDEIERIEIALRTQIIYHFAHEFGNNWYEDRNLFTCHEYHDKFIDILEDEMGRSREKFISHYRKKYTAPPNPPCWMALELASFGQLSSVYKNLKAYNAKKEVAAHFKIDESVLTSWLEAISYIRNTSAHHSRLWNRKLPKKPKLPNRPKDVWITILPEDAKRNRLYIGLSCILYLIRCIVPTTSFHIRCIGLMDEYPDIPKDYMGFPDNWKEDTFWASTI